MKEGYIESEYSIMWIENGIGYQTYKPGINITLEIAKQMVKDRVQSFNGVARPVLVDIRSLKSIDAASRRYFASKEAGELILAGAIYLASPLARWAGNVFLNIDVPITPAKLFTDKDKALEWLERFKYNN
jgi:hypothetical protein